MAKDMMAKGAWAELAIPGSTLALRVTPNARHNTLTRDEGSLRCTVTAAPEDGNANHAVIVLLSHALGVARSRLVLTQGATSRDKVFRLD
jgi:uncharacterized protein YggU (UPF0235/DUF167 family)